MSKHAELQPIATGWPYVRELADRMSARKRLTDAELAAEFQHSRLVSFVRHRRTQNCPTDMTLFDHYESGLNEEWTLERFATLPHYDE